MTNVQSISPDSTPFASHEISGTGQQQTLPVGPTGKVHRGGGTVPWAKRCALSTAPSPSSKLLFMVLASFVNGPDEAAWPSQSTLADMTGLTARGVRNATKQLEAAGRIRVERMGGDKGIRYCLEAEVSSPYRRKSVPVEAEVSSPEVRTNEDTSTSAQPIQEIGSRGLNKPANRYTCSCGHSWPKSTGAVCYQCHQSVGEGSQLQADYASRYRSARHHNAGLAAPEPGKYNDLFESDGTAPRGAPSAKSTNKRRVTEKPTALSGAVWGSQRTWRYQRADGSWA